MSDDKIVWSDQHGDMRKKDRSTTEEKVVEEDVLLMLRRLTSGKGRTVIEITGLPNNKNWCKKLAKGLKKSLGVGGSYKMDVIEVHGEKITEVTTFLSGIGLRWKQVGG